MNRRIVLIRPFFCGHFLNYFQLFLNSCGNNPDFDWIVFTDNNDYYNYPPNVHKVYMTFDQAKELFQSKFDFPLTINTPYKLCDYKSAFGYVFKDYIREYDFWGHTDYDIIYGRLDHFIKDEMLEKYDKLFVLGHFSLYRNTKDVCEMFMKDYNGRLLYKEAMTSESNKNFDEDWNGILNVNDLFRLYNKPLYENEGNISMIADLHDKSTDFRVEYQKKGEWKDIIEKKKKNFFVYEDGELNRYEMQNGVLSKVEYMYIHLKHRKMSYDPQNMTHNRYAIIPDAFEPLDFQITEESFNLVKRKTARSYYNYFNLRWNNLKTKANMKMKSIK